MLPSPDDYTDWKDFARALMAALDEGNADITAGGVGGSVPTDLLPNPPAGFEPVYLSTDTGDLVTVDSFWDEPPFPIEPFQIDTLNLALASVATSNIQGFAITNGLLADGSVTTLKVQAAAIGTAQIANAAIVTALIGDAQIVNAKIANLAVNTAQIADLAVQTAKINDLAVNTAKIANLAVTNAQIALATITNAQIANATILTANIANAQITNALIANAAIYQANIANAQIGTAQIQNAAITNALIADATILAAKIALATITAAQIADASITNAKITNLVVDKLLSGTLDATIDVGTGVLKFTIGGNSLYIGRGFGTSSQFIMWFGPSQADLSTCTEAAAVFYLKRTGDAYFGGTLLAGTLVNGGSTSLATSTLTIETGDFGSNGGSRVYTASFSLDRVNYLTGSHTISGTNSAKIYIDKWNGVSWVQLTSLTLTGGGSPPNGTSNFGFDPEGSAWTDNIGGSVQFTDNSGGTGPINVRARMDTRTLRSESGSGGAGTTPPSFQQRLSIQSIEE